MKSGYMFNNYNETMHTGCPRKLYTVFQKTKTKNKTKQNKKKIKNQKYKINSDSDDNTCKVVVDVSST